MSSYTLTIGAIIRDSAIAYGKKNNIPIPIDLEGQLDLARHEIFDFDYAIFDDSYKKEFEINFLRYFHEYEIGQDTVARFKVYLRQFMMTQFPKFNTAYQFQYDQAKYMFFQNFKKSIADGNSNSDVTGNVKSKEDSTTVDDINLKSNKLNTIEGSIDDTNTGNTTVVGNINKTDNGKESSTGTTNVDGTASSSESEDAVQYIQTSSKTDTTSSGKNHQTQTDSTSSTTDNTSKLDSNNTTNLNTKSSKSYNDFKDKTDITADTKVNKQNDKNGNVDTVGNTKNVNHDELIEYSWNKAPWEVIMSFTSSFQTIDEMVYTSAIDYGLFMLIW